MKRPILRAMLMFLAITLAQGLLWGGGRHTWAQLDGPSIDLVLNQSVFRPGDELQLRVSIDSAGSNAIVDAYLGLVLPDGRLFLLRPDFSSFGLELAPLASGFPLFDLPGPVTIFTFAFGPGATLPEGLGQQPPGLYSFAAVFVEAGSSPLNPGNWVGQLEIETFRFEEAPPGAVSFSAQIQPIFDANCVICHGGRFPEVNLDLESDSSYNSLVNVPSVEVGPDLLVNPGNPSTGPGGSYLVEKISLDAPRIGLRMPFGGPSLPESSIQLIIDWISQGAPNN